MKWTGRYEGYGVSALRKDVISGLIVGIIAIPLGMAFAIAAGVKPEYGIYTTVVAGILISLLGGSRYQIGGPTGAFIPVLLAIVLQYGYDNLLIAGFMAGIILVLMGTLKLGAWIRFIPRPVTIGFTSGIAVIIFTGQIQNFLGLRGVQQHEYWLANLSEIAAHLTTLNSYSVITATVGLTAALLATRFLPKIPGSLLGLAASTAIAVLFFRGQVATIESSFGAIPHTLPRLHLPEITWERLRSLLYPAFVIAMLGGVESLLSAVVADRMTGTRHNSNRELIGQGIANMAAPLIGGIPATGAIARTATNIKSGAQSPIAGIVHGAVVLLVLIALAPYASGIPLAGMAPILMLVAWNMSERREFMHILSARTSDSAVLLLTFALTVLTNLTLSVAVGLGLSILLFVRRTSRSFNVSDVSEPPPSSLRHPSCPLIRTLKIEGPLFFGTAHRLNGITDKMMDNGQQIPAMLLLQMSNVSDMDLTGESGLAHLIEDFRKSGGTVLVAGLSPQAMTVIKKTGLWDAIGEDRFFADVDQAMEYAVKERNLLG